MWQRFTALVSAIKITGTVPASLRVLSSLAGIAVIVLAVAVFVNQSWDSGISDSGIVYTGLILMIGVLLLRSSVPPKKGPDDDS